MNFPFILLYKHVAVCLVAAGLCFLLVLIAELIEQYRIGRDIDDEK